jgi:hypothetical protein
MESQSLYIDLFNYPIAILHMFLRYSPASTGLRAFPILPQNHLSLRSAFCNHAANTTMAASESAIIIGGGIVGLSTAYHLARAQNRGNNISIINIPLDLVTAASAKANTGHGTGGISLGPASGLVTSELVRGLQPSDGIRGLGVPR